MGESALKSHVKAEKHKVNIQQLQTKSMVTISSFFKKSTGDDLKEKETAFGGSRYGNTPPTSQPKHDSVIAANFSALTELLRFPIPNPPIPIFL